jgi:hypothetical protein
VLLSLPSQTGPHRILSGVSLIQLDMELRGMASFPADNYCCNVWCVRMPNYTWQQQGKGAWPGMRHGRQDDCSQQQHGWPIACRQEHATDHSQ